MIKNLTGGALISYGTAFPPVAEAYDGALFYKSNGIDQGLYIFSFNADSNELVIGEQVTQGWNAVVSPALYVAKSGDTMTGDLVIQSGGTYKGLRLLNSAGTSGGSISVPAGSGAGITLSSDAGPMTFMAGGVNRMILQANGNLQLITAAGTANVWTNLNDGAGSGLDADLFDGQDTAYFLNASNINAGTLNQNRLPFVPVQQGGGTGQLNNKVYIGWASTGVLNLQVDSTNFANTWPINISGTAAAATNATYATTAGDATNAQSAQFLRKNGATNGGAMIFRVAQQNANPPAVWGSNDGGDNSYLWRTADLVVASAASATTSQSTGAVRRSGTGANMTFHWQDPGGAPTYVWGSTDGVNMYVYQPNSFVPTTVQNANYASRAGTIDSPNSGAVGGVFFPTFVTDAGNGKVPYCHDVFKYTPSTGTITANVFQGVATSARYADLAEIYSTDKHYPVGTVMAVSYEDGADATCSAGHNQKVIGVISEKPGFLMNKEAEGQPIALKGRVPVRIVGMISKGQMVGSGPEGTGRGLSDDGIREFGVALESSDDEGEKLIECVIL